MAEYCGIKIIVCEPGMVIKDQRGQEFVVTESNVVFDGTHAYVSPKTNEQFATAATSHFPVQATVNIDEIVQPLEDIHAPDGLCRWTDVATAIGEVRRTLSALEPSAARELASEEGDLNARLIAKGMYSIDEMMGSLPLDKWRVHSGMTDLKFFGEWLERKTREYCTMRAAYEVGDKDQSDDLYEWVLAHYGAFHDVLVNFRAALSSPDHADAGKVDGNGLRDDVAKVYVWLREPDWNEEWDLCGWLNRRPSPNSFALIHEQWERSTLPPAPASEGGE
ncbi:MULTISPECIES: hypothetical protein [unclassified Brucella]|uniref:hypothetical protein n=1 Tax=unclassified Brucella TaxID=2632610 RepID=UPI0012AE131B|nr:MULTISPECIES: hypothetical protein [unclassified Brucella]MRN43429.1 hypothetical protein [Brucella sp. 09RB8913]MRN59403.1 hypothetical protein [Brucella sp. 09RB8918]